MTPKLKALLVAATVAVVAAPAVNAMETELNALTGAVYNDLNSMQMDLASINDLTLADIQTIDQIMHGGDTESEKRNKINSVLRKAAER